MAENPEPLTEELRALRADMASDPGMPWKVARGDEGHGFHERRVTNADGSLVAEHALRGDAVLIVAAVNALPALLDALDAERSRSAALLAVAEAALRQAGDRFEVMGRHMKPDATDEDREALATNWWFGSEEIRATLDTLESAS